MSKRKELIIREKSVKRQKERKEKRDKLRNKNIPAIQKSSINNYSIDSEKINNYISRNRDNLISCIDDYVCYSNCKPLADAKKKKISVRFKELIDYLLIFKPKLLDESYWDSLWLLSSVSWEREIIDWKPSGYSIYTLFISLVKHLLVKYPVRHFLFSAFFMPLETATYKLVKMFKYVASGTSLYQFNSNKMKVPQFTKRMCHLFLQSPVTLNIYQAARYAQVQAFGGNKQLAHKLSLSILGDNFYYNEQFWSTVIQWFCNNQTVKIDNIYSLINYIDHKYSKDADFSIKGRSPTALISEMNEQKRRIRQSRENIEYIYKKSGWKTGIWEIKKEIAKDIEYINIWSMEEVLSSRELLREANAMKHCVYNYNRHIREGTTSIWSLRENDSRRLTVEVCKKCGAIEQAKGKFNRQAEADELKVLNTWATENNLSIKL